MILQHQDLYCATRCLQDQAVPWLCVGLFTVTGPQEPLNALLTWRKSTFMAVHLLSTAASTVLCVALHYVHMLEEYLYL